MAVVDGDLQAFERMKKFSPRSNYSTIELLGPDDRNQWHAKDPEIKHSIEQRDQLADYWQTCANSMKSPRATFRQNDPGKGRYYCRFASLEEGVKFGVEIQAKDSSLWVYLGVAPSAPRKQRNLFKDLVENHIGELEAQLGQKLHLYGNYFWVTTPANLNDRTDWPRQHKWLLETAEKFVVVFKSRLAID